MNTQLQYRTFDELLNDIQVDLNVFSTEGFIDPAQLIKVAQRVNYDLGMRIHGTKEVILDIEHGKVKLPDDFYVLNYALLCGKYTVTQQVPTGRQTEDLILDATTCIRCGSPDPTCACEKTFTTDCGTHIKVIQKLKFEVRTYEIFEPIKIVPSGTVAGDCPNTRMDATYKAEIKNGFLYTNITSGRIFLNYQGALEDDNGNLLVLYHPLINEYYEYALKQRILENMYMNGEDVIQRLQLVEQRLKAARNNALSIVNTPDFSEMKQLWEMNRKAQYHKFYNAFK